MAMTIAEIIVSPWFGCWFFGLFTIWMILSFLFRRVEAFRSKPYASAHQFVLLVPFLFLAVQGTRMWFFDAKFWTAFKDDKIYGDYQDSTNLVLMMFAFQVWDFVISLVTKELRLAQHLGHHGTTAVLALSALLNGPHGFSMYYAAFFFGVSEISSVPLAGVDLFRMHKDLSAHFPKTNEACRICFAVSFLAIRCVYWPFVTVDFWVNSLRSDAPVPLLAFWYVVNIGLTGLQYFWGFLVLKGIIKLAKGKPAAGTESVAQEDAGGARGVSLHAQDAGDAVNAPAGTVRLID